MTDVQLILRSDVPGLGKRGEVVVVSPGYARNYLVPRGMAIKSTPGAEGQAEAMRRARMLRDAKDREASQEVAKVLVPKTILITARTGGGGKLFGSVTASDIADAIAAQTPAVVDKRAIHLNEHIKTTGPHAVQVRLPGDVEFPVNIEVTGS
jgi:large subunit ribosomal protein L9